MDVLSATLITSGSATAIACLIGIPLGAWLSTMKQNWVLKTTSLLVRTLYGLPPVVVGIWVYLVLSKDGILADLDWLYSIKGMILAQTVLILPLVLGFSWFSFERYEARRGDVARMTGANKWQLLRLKIAGARGGVMQGVALSFGRAIAEVGAVLMVGGNIAGQTRVMTTSIVLETSVGDLDNALILGFQLLAISMLVMFFTFDVPFVSRKKRVTSIDPIPDSTPCGEVVVKGLGVEGILEDVEFSIPAGTITVVLGESGAGKSTLLKAVAGLIPSKGGMLGVPEVGPNGTCMVFQEQVWLRRHVDEELVLARDLHGMPDCSGNILEKLGLSELVNRRMSSLSGGERQRILVMRNMAMAPSLLLLDEFTSSLDGASIEMLEGIVKEHRESGGSAIIVTHNVLQAERLADQILFMHNGRLVSKESDAAEALLSGQWTG